MVAGRDGQKLSKLKANEFDKEEYFVRLDDYLKQLNATEILGEDALRSDDFLKYFEACRQTLNENTIGSNPLPRQMVEVHATADRYMKSESIAYSRGLLFRTRLGFMGQCGGPCAVGDQVWALRDAHVPFVLRKSSLTDDFEIVGAAFVLNKMQGEMMRDVKLGNIRIV
jgi:hypothetical protein